jgi:hypothetical protein
MKPRIALVAIALALALGGCATFNTAELAQLRQLRIRPDLMDKLEHKRPLEPEEIIELKRAGMSDELIVKHLNDVGVDYILTRPDIEKLRAARISPRVMQALAFASSRFTSGVMRYNSYDPYFFYDPWFPGLYGDWTIGFGFGGGHHDHHGHDGHHHGRHH